MVPLLDLHLKWALETASGGKLQTSWNPTITGWLGNCCRKRSDQIDPERHQFCDYAKSAENWLVTPPVLQANSFAKRTPGLPQDSRKWSIKVGNNICKIIVNHLLATYTISYTDCNYMNLGIDLGQLWSKPKWAGSCHSVPSAPHSQALDGWAFRSATSARRRVQRCPIPRCRLGTGHGRGGAHRGTTTGEYDIAWYSPKYITNSFRIQYARQKQRYPKQDLGFCRAILGGETYNLGPNCSNPSLVFTCFTLKSWLQKGSKPCGEWGEREICRKPCWFMVKAM